MQIALQIMMGIGLAACAGLRAWLPLFAVSLLAHFGQIPLNDSFRFLGRPEFMIIFGIATVIELIGDKFIAVDHLLDSIGTVVRPVAGMLLAASVVTQQDPVFSTVLGIILGGGTALTIHSGKAAARTAATAFSPVHAGSANLAMSVGEDALSFGGIALSFFWPFIAFALAVVAVIFAIRLRRAATRQRQRILETLKIGKKSSAVP